MFLSFRVFLGLLFLGDLLFVQAFVGLLFPTVFCSRIWVGFPFPALTVFSFSFSFSVHFCFGALLGPAFLDVRLFVQGSFGLVFRIVLSFSHLG